MADTIPTLREAAQQALEALVHMTGVLNAAGWATGHADAAVKALRAALAEQAAEQAVIPPAFAHAASQQMAVTSEWCRGWDACRAHILSAAPAAEQAGAIPAGWVPLRMEWEPGYPEDVAFGPPMMMERLKKWLDKHFAARVAEANAEQVEPVAVPASIVAGAIFDFAGFLTTHKCVIKVGSTANASPVVERIKEWAGLRGLPLDNADVLSWQKNTAPPAPAAAEQAEPAVGFRLLPSRLTNEMRAAMADAARAYMARTGGNSPDAMYDAAVAAAPPAPARQPAPALTVGMLMEAGLMVGSTPDSVGTSNWAVRMLGALRALAGDQPDAPRAPALQPLTEERATSLVQSVVSSSERPIGMVAYGLLVARATERAHGITAAPAEGEKQ